MEQVFLTFLNIFKAICLGITQAWDFLTATWFTWGTGDEAVAVSPIMLFSVAGLLVVAAVMLIKFLNPLN